MGKIINASEYYDENDSEINRLILKCSSETLSKIENLLPNEEELLSSDIFKSWRYGYLMDYFMGVNIADDLEDYNDNAYNEYIENIRFKMYIMFFKENYSKNIIYYEEFLLLSRLLYETIKQKKLINEEHKEKIKSDIEKLPDAVRVIYDILNTSSNNKYEFDKNKLRVVDGRIKSTKIDMIDEEVNKLESKKVLLFKSIQKDKEE